MAPIIHERHTTDIQVDDEFAFRGLTGQEVDAEATVKIVWISHDGNLFYEVTPTSPASRRRHTIPIDRASVLIEQGIWKLKEKN